jgi:hypothetical protein
LNARVQRVFVRVFVFDTLVLLLEQCASFSCLSLGGQSIMLPFFGNQMANG